MRVLHAFADASTTEARRGWMSSSFVVDLRTSRLYCSLQMHSPQKGLSALSKQTRKRERLSQFKSS